MSNLSEEFTFDVDEKSIENFKKSINYDELEVKHQRFMNGTETEDDLINGIYHYRIQNDNGLDLDVVEFKYYQKILHLYEGEKEKNKELNDTNMKMDVNGGSISAKHYIEENYIPKSKVKEIIYPTPENPISFEVQSSEMYKKLEKLVEGE